MEATDLLELRISYWNADRRLWITNQRSRHAQILGELGVGRMVTLDVIVLFWTVTA